MITLRGVSKRFRLYPSARERVKSWLGLPAYVSDFWALRDIDLDVPQGSAVGIVGTNGAGKSTLLKLITGTLLPTSGTIIVGGRIAALLELGTGFHPEFTGRQNIHVNGQLLGLTPEELRDREAGIIDFSELGLFIDQPLRTYSSGMIMRLGFSIAAAVRPQVLIVDEALAVGDARFSQKCIRRMRGFLEEGMTLLYVSHDPTSILALCDDVVLLDEGRIAGSGHPREMLDLYNARIATKGGGNASYEIRRHETSTGVLSHRSGNRRAMIHTLAIHDGSGRNADTFAPGDTATFDITILFLGAVRNPSTGILIRDRLGFDVYGTNTALRRVNEGTFGPGDALSVSFRVPLDIGEGDYTVTVAVHSDENHLEECYDWVDHLGTFHVRHTERPNWKGMAFLRPQLSTRPATIAPRDFHAAIAAIAPRQDDFLVIDGGTRPVSGAGATLGQERLLPGTRLRLPATILTGAAPDTLVLSFAEAPDPPVSARIVGDDAPAALSAGDRLELPVPRAHRKGAALFEMTSSAVSGADSSQSPPVREVVVRAVGPKG